MVLLGLAPEIAARRQDMLTHLNGMPTQEQNQLLAVYWHVAQSGAVTEEFGKDLREITAAIKRTQFAQEAVGFQLS
jgi:hypothetical protein